MKKTQDLGKKLFSFAVVADTHLNQDEMDCNSPFPVNTLANLRMRHVVQDINTQDVDFVVHLGDIIHPVPAVKNLYVQAAARFHAQVKDLSVPLYLTPGNHDIGDKPMPWAPAGTITDEYVSLWREVFGKDYFSFCHKGVCFIVFNSQLCNSGLALEAEQEAWLEAELQKHEHKRMFFCTHYPPFMYDRHEPEHYDNIAEPARSRLLALLDTYAVEGLFAGHVHNFWYLQEDAVHHYLLPSTAFVRQDYSEMLKTPPAFEATEAGRNDAEKLGYFVVHMYEHGHVCRMVRTHGTCVEEKSAAHMTQKKPCIKTVSPQENTCASLGFDLRDSWAHAVSIAPSGALDEFDRKEVRNDYPLLALWEMGVRHVRVPFHDLRDAKVRERMEHLVSLGHSFTLFSFGEISTADRQLVAKHAHLLRGWEIACRWDTLPSMAKSIAKVRKVTDLPLYLSRMWEHEDNKSPDGRYFHVMNHGLTAKNITENAAYFTAVEALAHLEEVGFVFRIMRHEDMHEAMQAILTFTKMSERPCSVHVRMADFNPSYVTATCSEVDDRFNSVCLAQALFCSAYTDIHVFADTLIDVDRGYFPRYGVLDSICNPRAAAHVVAHVYGFLHEGVGAFDAMQIIEDTTMRVLWAKQGQESVACIFPKKENMPLSKAKIEEIAQQIAQNNSIQQIQLVDAVQGIKYAAQDVDGAQPVYLLRVS